MGWILFSVLAVIVLIILLTNIKIVPQTHEFVIEFLGKYKTTWTAGFHVKIPFFERIVKIITLKEQVLDSPPQPVITKDNVTMQIDTVIYYSIYDAKLYAYGAVNPISALSNLAATTLRNIVGELELDGTLTSRDTINAKMTDILDEATDKWGIKVNRVELKNIIPPSFLAKKSEADGLRELKAAGVDAVILEMKKYEALVAMSNGKASKIIVPTNAVDMTKANVLFSETTGLGDATPEGKDDPKPEKKPDPCCE